VVLPKFMAGSVATIAAGVGLLYWAPSDLAVQAGSWLAGAGGVGAVTAALLFWRVGPGLLLALPLWLGLAGAITSATGAPAGAWLTTAGVLAAVSLAAVALNRAVGAGLVLAAWLLYAAFLLKAVPARIEAHAYWWPILVAGVVALVATVARVAMSRSSARGLLRRLGRAGRETDGMASAADVWRGASARVVRAKAAQVRPSLQEVSRWTRRRTPLTELGVRITRVGSVGVWSSAEDHTITFGGPRKGKTQQIMNYAVEAPGALITTSTKHDLLAQTYRRRARRGPVWIFDPSGVIQPGSKLARELDANDAVTSVRFDPLNGCESAATAMDRAADLIDGVGRAGGTEGERWDGFAKQTLQSLLHAAALGGYSMYDVQQWVAHPSEEAMRTVVFELKMAGPAAAGMVQEATQFFKNNPNTQSSISTGIMPALSWLSVPTAAATATRGGQQFDVQQLLAENGSVYLLGKDDSKVSPLVTALTADLARRAEAIASGMPEGRLDPFLTMVLDEAALICLIPLDRWSGDFGSRGICLHIAAQSRAQMRQRFGDAATGTLLTNTATKIVFGGTGDHEDLQYWATLAGERDEAAITRDRATGSQSESTRRIQVLTPGQVGELRARQMLVISNNMPPAIVKARMYYRRLDVRTERYADKAARARERFVNLPTVQGMAAFTDRVADGFGQWLLDRFAWMLAPLTGDAQVAAGGAVVDPLPVRRRAPRGLVTRRLDAVLTWLEAADPLRELVARLRLNNSTRKARSALGDRARATRDREVRR
jgi:type IV secretory pathway TraG/TraD family ATPase VirD4